MRQSRSLLPALAICCALASAASAQTNVSGTILDAIWTKAGSPYRVVGECTVATDNTLIIEAGVDVLSDADVRLTVNGALHAMGTEADSVRFLPGFAATWGGVEIVGSDSSSMAYTRVSGARSGGSGGGLLLRAEDWETPAPRFHAANCVFSGNHAQDGGGIALMDGAVATLDSTVISSNSVAGFGGGISCISPVSVLGELGISNEACRISMRGCDVLDNRATYGGGVRGWAADVELVGSSVQGNQSDRGGGLFVIYSDVTMRETSMLRNRATGRDGAISALASNLEFVQCLIAGNEAPSVGGIWCSSAEGQYSAAVLVSGSTVAGNDGGELAVDAGTVVDVSNSIVWGEPARGVRTDVGEWTVEYSDIGPIESTRPGPGNVNTNPLFVDPANGDYSLLPGSPCIDAGDPGYADPDYTRLDMGHTGGPPIAAYPRLVVSDTLRHVTFDTPALLLVRNVGETAQSVLGIALPDGFATPREFPKEIAPGDSATFVIVFTGSEDALGLVAAITHTDPFQGPISIGLSGLIGGGVSGEAVGTWSESDSPYRVVGEIAVPAGETLTIEPGVDVLFAVDVPFRVEGALHTRGT